MGGACLSGTTSHSPEGSFTEIATGFCGSGAPGSVFAPSGLTYDASIDTLCIVDTSSNSVLAFSKVSSIGADGVTVNGQCASVAAPPTPALTFSGPSASMRRRCYPHGQREPRFVDDNDESPLVADFWKQAELF
jgi:hypothetical protein